jgi:hypothetical protein
MTNHGGVHQTKGDAMYWLHEQGVPGTRQKAIRKQAHVICYVHDTKATKYTNSLNDFVSKEQNKNFRQNVNKLTDAHQKFGRSYFVKSHEEECVNDSSIYTIHEYISKKHYDT